MKVLSLLLIVFMSFSALAEKNYKDLTIQSFVKVMSESHSQEIPESLKSLLVQDLLISGPHIFFKIKSFPIHIELIKSKKIAMKVNGVSFSPEDFSDKNFLRFQFSKKFKVQRKRFSLLELFFEKAHAVYIQGDVPLYVAQNLSNSGYQVRYNNGYNQRRTYRDMPSLIAAVNSSGNQGPALMAAIMGAANNLQLQGPQYPEIKPFRLKSSKSSS